MNGLIIILLIIVALALPVRLEWSGNYSKQGLYGKIKVQYAFFHWQKKFDHQLQSQNTIKQPTLRKNNNLPVQKFSKINLKENWAQGKSLAHWLFKRLTIERLVIEVRVGLPNAQILGYLSGIMWAALGAINQNLQRKLPINVSFVPLFAKQQSRVVFITAEGIISITLGQIILSAVKLGILWIKELLVLQKVSQRREVYE